MPRTAAKLSRPRVAEYREVDCTPLAKRVFPKVIQLRSPGWKEGEDGDPASSKQKEPGFAIDIYQSTKPAPGPHELSVHALQPGRFDVWVHIVDGKGGSHDLESWHTDLADIEALARGLLECVAVARQQGVVT